MVKKLILVTSPPACGKTYISKALAYRLEHVVYLDKEQVIFWLEQFKDGNIEDEDFRRQLIDLFVNSVTVWDEPDDYFKITIAYNLTSLQDKTYRLPKGGTLSDFASNTPALKSNPIIEGTLMFHTTFQQYSPYTRYRG